MRWQREAGQLRTYSRTGYLCGKLVLDILEDLWKLLKHIGNVNYPLPLPPLGCPVQAGHASVAKESTYCRSQGPEGISVLLAVSANRCGQGTYSTCWGQF